jgi:hypothetical protein
LAKYYQNPPGSNQKADAGMKYRSPKSHQIIRAIFDDYETETQAKMISLLDSAFVDEDQSDHVLTTDDGFDTSSSNNEEEGLESSDEEGSASGLDSFDFSGSQLGSKGLSSWEARRTKLGIHQRKVNCITTTVKPEIDTWTEEEGQSSIEDYTDEICQKGEETNQDIEGSG